MFIENKNITQLAENTWVANANIAENIELSNKNQKKAVRVLLKWVMEQLNIDDKFDDNQFPFRFVNSGFYVCFTHSANKVALVISDSNIAIDIEEKNVPWKVAERFYHQEEVEYLSSLSIKNREVACQLLWKLKECMIKLNNEKLFVGISINYINYIPKLLALTDYNSNYIYNEDNDTFENRSIINQEKDFKKITRIRTEGFDIFYEDTLKIIILKKIAAI